MEGSHVVVVATADAHVPRNLMAALSKAPFDDEPFDVVPCTTPQGALNACYALEPECLVLDLAIGSPGADHVVVTLRHGSDRIAAMPIVGLYDHHDEALLVGALRLGFDRCLSRRASGSELAGQVRALVELARRVRARRALARKQEANPVESNDAVSTGDRVTTVDTPSVGHPQRLVGLLDGLGVTAVLTALEIEGRSGELLLSEGIDRLRIQIVHGFIRSGQEDLGGHPLGSRLDPVATVAAALCWASGRFEFVPAQQSLRLDSGVPLARLVIEAERVHPRRPHPKDRRRSGARRRVLTPPAAASQRQLLESMNPPKDAKQSGNRGG